MFRGNLANRVSVVGVRPYKHDMHRGGIDGLLARLPGSTSVKAVVAAFALTGAFAYPVFFRSKETRQGHDYLSSERPEAVSAGQDRLRKENRKRRGLTLSDKKEGDATAETRE